MKKAIQGFTLIELFVVVGVLTLTLVALGSIFIGFNRFVVLATTRGNVVEECRKTLDELEQELMMARVLVVDVGINGPPRLEYLLPVDIGEDANDNSVLDLDEDTNGNGVLDEFDGDVVSVSGDIEWGCIEADGIHLDLAGSPHRITLTFSITATIAESVEGLDINGDGDRDDSFAVGTLTRTTTDGLTRTYGMGSMILASPSLAGDRDGDGINDPLVSVTGEAFTDSNASGTWESPEIFVDTNGNGEWDGFIRMHLSFYARDRDNNPLHLQIVREIAPRNPQE